MMFKRRSSRGSFDDEVTVTTDLEENVAKFQDTFVLTRQVSTDCGLVTEFLVLVLRNFSLDHSISDFRMHSVSSVGMCSQSYWSSEMRQDH